MPSDPRFTHPFALLTLLFTLVLCAGCHRTISQSSLVDSLAGPDADLDFFDQLQTARTVTNHDALHALILLADGSDPSASFEDRLALAQQKNWLAPGRSIDPNASAALGDISVALCQILDIQGGVNLRLFGPSRRYCTRELVYRQIIPARTESQSISGLELLNLLGNAEDYRKNGFVPNQKPNYSYSLGS